MVSNDSFLVDDTDSSSQSSTSSSISSTSSSRDEYRLENNVAIFMRRKRKRGWLKRKAGSMFRRPIIN